MKTKKVPKRETRADITAAINLVEKAVRSDMTKEGLVQFRIEKNELEKLYELAEKYHKPLGAMVREWVVDRVKTEIEGTSPFEKLATAIADMQAKVEKLERFSRSEPDVIVLDVDMPDFYEVASQDPRIRVGGKIVILQPQAACKHSELTEKIRKALST
ncbi:MAG: hypothetical protein ACRD3W_25005 [Terriglobales bacterium]